METVDNLRNRLSVSRISKITGIQRSYIYYNRKSTAKQRKSRISDNTINRLLEISRERVTYGYRILYLLLEKSIEPDPLTRNGILRFLNSSIITFPEPLTLLKSMEKSEYFLPFLSTLFFIISAIFLASSPGFANSICTA